MKPNIPDIPESVLKLYAAVDPEAFAKLLGWEFSPDHSGPSASFRIPKGTFGTLPELFAWLENLGLELHAWEKNPENEKANLDYFNENRAFQVYIRL